MSTDSPTPDEEDDGRDLLGKWAVVTGASSGLGADFADILAGRGCSLVLVARREERLLSLKSRLERADVKVLVLPLDLSQSDAPARLYAFTKDRNLTIDFLINNAGFGKTGPFIAGTWEYDERMLNLNVRAVHHLTKLFVTEMVARGEGRILNVASVAGFRPLGNFAAYAATKAYVLHLSEAIHAELAAMRVDVQVSALCPGLTRTEFFDAGKATRFMKWSMMDSLPVARAGIDLMLHGGAYVVPGWLNRFIIFLGRVLPRTWLTKTALPLLDNE